MDLVFVKLRILRSTYVILMFTTEYLTLVKNLTINFKELNAVVMKNTMRHWLATIICTVQIQSKAKIILAHQNSYLNAKQ